MLLWDFYISSIYNHSGEVDKRSLNKPLRPEQNGWPAVCRLHSYIIYCLVFWLKFTDICFEKRAAITKFVCFLCFIWIAKLGEETWPMRRYNSIIYYTYLYMWYNFCLKIKPDWQEVPPNLIELQSSRLYRDSRLSHIPTALWLIYCEHGPQYRSKQLDWEPFTGNISGRNKASKWIPNRSNRCDTWEHEGNMIAW